MCSNIISTTQTSCFWVKNENDCHLCPRRFNHFQAAISEKFLNPKIPPMGKVLLKHSYFVKEAFNCTLVLQVTVLPLLFGRRILIARKTAAGLVGSTSASGATCRCRRSRASPSSQCCRRLCNRSSQGEGDRK